jgi:hypothetical protein
LTVYSTRALSTFPPGISMCSRLMASSTSVAARPRARISSPSSQIRMARSRLPKSTIAATPGTVSSWGLTWCRMYSLTSTTGRLE